jgi:hypothetical protein
MEVVAVALAAVAGLVDQRADNMDAEPANAALFCGLLQTRHVESEWIKRLAIVYKSHPQAVGPPPERHDHGSARRTRPMTMRYGIGEELIENDQKPRPLVIRQAALLRELDGKSLKPSELCGLGT